MAVSLKKHVSWLQHVMAETVGLHYVRTRQTIDSIHVVGAADWLVALSA